MNRYHFTHVTEFHYDAPVSESYNEVCMRPMHDDKQSCLSFRLTTSPGSRSTAYRDAFGNWVHQFNILSEHRHLTVEAESVVLTHEEPPPANGSIGLTELDEQQDELCEEYFDFVAPTPYVPHDPPELDELVQLAEQAGEGTALSFAESASDLIHRQFKYVKAAFARISRICS
ncbi:MAG: transglutaminase N-terminal domain-containing protein [Acidobacteriota bacterium]|jgi:transglutaminase-like putative cysteine protease